MAAEAVLRSSQKSRHNVAALGRVCAAPEKSSRHPATSATSFNPGVLPCCAIMLLWCTTGELHAEVRTWDGRHSIERIAVTAVYFVPSDRTPLPDWRERVDYFCRRIEQFHAREYRGQSTLTTQVLEEPFLSARTTEQLRAGDADFIFFQTLREVDEGLSFAQGDRAAFPILLVLSDINWRPLDDFYRLKPLSDGYEFEGNYSDQQHFPGAASGGARATYLAERGVGWGLVSADGWRVPYRGSDCVVYHEGVGHTVGLPHPEPGNGSVMSLGQYQGWISESWLDDAQKERLGWSAPETPFDRGRDLFSSFRAIPEPRVPQPGQAAALACDWPADARLKSCRVRIQTDVWGPWTEINQSIDGDDPPARLTLGRFDRSTPISYRVDAKLQDGQAVELWGYLQVRSDPGTLPLPAWRGSDLQSESAPDAPAASAREEIDLLPLIQVDRDAVSGSWQMDAGDLLSPKQYGARIEIPYTPPAEYRLTAIAEPLDPPNGLILGQRSGDSRFLALINYDNGDGTASALENVDGRNVDTGPTTVRGRLLRQGRPSEVICTVRIGSVTVSVDGRQIIAWKGDASRLSLSDYWTTPRADAFFIGAYDCRYRITRLGITPISGDGRVLGAD